MLLLLPKAAAMRSTTSVVKLYHHHVLHTGLTLLESDLNNQRSPCALCIKLKSLFNFKLIWWVIQSPFISSLLSTANSISEEDEKKMVLSFKSLQLLQISMSSKLSSNCLRNFLIFFNITNLAFLWRQRYVLHASLTINTKYWCSLMY